MHREKKRRRKRLAESLHAADPLIVMGNLETGRSGGIRNVAIRGRRGGAPSSRHGKRKPYLVSGFSSLLLLSFATGAFLSSPLLFSLAAAFFSSPLPFFLASVFFSSPLPFSLASVFFSSPLPFVSSAASAAEAKNIEAINTVRKRLM